MLSFKSKKSMERTKYNIVFMGAPSTGKTTICKALAAYFDTAWMAEYGKEYWVRNQVDRRLTQEQLLEIAQVHLEKEDQLLASVDKLLFTDTNPITTYMFALDYYGEVEEGLSELARASEQRYDLFFVCDTDIPYEDTWERSGKVYRDRFQKMILEDLKERGLDYILLSGSLDQRIAKVLSILKIMEI